MLQKKSISHPVLLIILDGFGYSPEELCNSYTPFLHSLIEQYPNTLLQASGESVGLMPGQASDSQVGHLIIGSGRIVEQNSKKITRSIRDKSFFLNTVLEQTMQKVASEDKTLHLVGLLSDGMVHSNIEHLEALIKLAAHYQVKKLSLHLFLDGRDVNAQSAQKYLRIVDQICRFYKIGSISTIHGRFFAMDRDNNWQRTYQSYRCMTQAEQMVFDRWVDILPYYYERGVYDEFIPPTQLKASLLVDSGDSMIFFNFRADRMRQLVSSFLEKPFDHFPKKRLILSLLVTLTDYGIDITSQVAFPIEYIDNTLKDVLSQAGNRILSIAESEKYAHVTYFFNGYRQEPVAHEKQIVVPSLPVATYAQSPFMSAEKITEQVINALSNNEFDFYLINYANADMVGHSGDSVAIGKALICLDNQIRYLVEALRRYGGTMYITADHGNAEEKCKQAGAFGSTYHTKNPVRFIMINNSLKGLKKKLALKSLADIAPFILTNMHLPVPIEMRSKS